MLRIGVKVMMKNVTDEHLIDKHEHCRVAFDACRGGLQI